MKDQCLQDGRVFEFHFVYVNILLLQNIFVFSILHCFQNSKAWTNITCGHRDARAQADECKRYACGGFDSHSGRMNYLIFSSLVTRQSASLIYATDHAMPPEFGENWETEVSY